MIDFDVVEPTNVTTQGYLQVDCGTSKVKAAGADPVDVATLANSITLTPGTLTLDVYRGELLVHTLTREGAEELRRGEMNERVGALREG